MSTGTPPMFVSCAISDAPNVSVLPILNVLLVPINTTNGEISVPASHTATLVNIRSTTIPPMKTSIELNAPIAITYAMSAMEQP